MPLLPARLAALPRRGVPSKSFSLRPYHRTPDGHPQPLSRLFCSLPFFFSSSSTSYSPHTSSPPCQFHQSLIAGGVRARGYCAPLFFRTDPLRRQDSDSIQTRYYTQRGTMTATKIDGTAIAKSIRDGLKTEIEQIQQANPRFKPSLVIFQGEITLLACLSTLIKSLTVYSPYSWRPIRFE